MDRISYILTAMLLTSSFIASPVLSSPRGMLARDGDRASDIGCVIYRGKPRCPLQKGDVEVSDQICNYIGGERICSGLPPKEKVEASDRVCYVLRGEPICVGPPSGANKKP